MAIEEDIVIVTLPGKMISRYMYIKNYVFSLDTKKLIEPNDKEKYGDRYWKDLYYLHPGKYLIIEVDIDMEESLMYKCMTVFTKEDYISNKRKQFPDTNIGNFKKIYQSCGSEIIEWNEDIPNWIKLPRECIPEIKEEHKQPQEVEDKLSSLLKEDDEKKPAIQYLSRLRNRR